MLVQQIINTDRLIKIDNRHVKQGLALAVIYTDIFCKLKVNMFCKCFPFKDQQLFNTEKKKKKKKKKTFSIGRHVCQLINTEV